MHAHMLFPCWGRTGIFLTTYFPTNIVISVCMFRKFTFKTILTSTKLYIYIIYIYIYIYIWSGATPGFWFGWGNIKQNFIHMNSYQILYCNGVAKILVRKGHSAKMYLPKTFENFCEFFKILHKYLKILQNL